jgi:hypothetical protein
VVANAITQALEAAADDSFVQKNPDKKDELRSLRRLRDQRRRTRKDEEKLTSLETEHGKWMRTDEWKKAQADLLWKRTKRLEADWVRVCDLGAVCPEMFDYTLLELAPPHLDHLLAAFEAEPGNAWDGKLVP